ARRRTRHANRRCGLLGRGARQTGQGRANDQQDTVVHASPPCFRAAHHARRSNNESGRLDHESARQSAELSIFARNAECEDRNAASPGQSSLPGARGKMEKSGKWSAARLSRSPVVDEAARFVWLNEASRFVDGRSPQIETQPKTSRGW